jgi:hypothetical protein
VRLLPAGLVALVKSFAAGTSNASTVACRLNLVVGVRHAVLATQLINLLAITRSLTWNELPAWHSLYGDFIPPTIGLVVGNNLTSSILAIGKIVAIQGIRVAVEIFEAIRNSSIDLLPKLCIVPPLATSRNVRIWISIFVTSLDSTQPNLQLAITATVTHIKCEIPLTLGDVYDNISVRMCRRKHGIVLNKLFSGEIPFLPRTCIVVIGRTCRLTIKNDRAQKHPCSGQNGK